MSRMGLVLASGLLPVLLGVSSPAASAKGLLRLSEGGQPVAQGAEITYRLALRPDGYSGSALQEGGGPLVNESKADGFRANEGADGQAGWLVDGSIEMITLASDGKATITSTGEAIANNEPEPVKPPPPRVRSSTAKWECFCPLPKKIKGTFSIAGVAVVTGTAKAGPSKLCHLPGFDVSFTLELLPEGLSGPALETSLVQ